MFNNKIIGGSSGGGDTTPLSNSIDSTDTNTAATSYAAKLLNDKITNSLDGKANVVHTHTEFYSKEEVDTRIINASNDLSDKVDNVTIALVSNELKVKSVDGLTIGVADVNNWLSGTTSNIQNQINAVNDTLVSLTSGMKYLGKVERYADLTSITTATNGSLVVVLADESRTGGRSLYVYSEQLGIWDFIGEFTFSDEFIELKDTPSSYSGQNGKIIKVDEVNNKVVFGDMDWSEIKNKPTSTITSIDNAVANSHEHANKQSLDKLGVNANNQLTINGVVYSNSPVQKEYLYCRRITTNQTVSANTNLIFNSKVNGTIPYNTSTGRFTLTQGKVYHITVTPLFNTTDWLALRVVDANTNTYPPEADNYAIFTNVNGTWHETPQGILSFIIVPNSTREFVVRCANTGSSSGKYEMRSSNSVITINEI